jgi:hypothetical protein
MLCDICSNINIDELIPLGQSDRHSGTHHHASYQALENAAKAGCELCRVIEIISTIEPAMLNRIRQLPVRLKMRLHSSASSFYQGGSRLMVSCGATIIAQVEAYVPRGMAIPRYQAVD